MVILGSLCWNSKAQYLHLHNAPDLLKDITHNPFQCNTSNKAAVDSKQ